MSQPQAPVKIAVGMATLNAPQLLNRCVTSVLGNTGVSPADVMVVMNAVHGADACRRWEQEGVHVHRPGWNTGTCRAWNYVCRRGFELGYDAVLVLNDDMELLDPETISKYAAKLSMEPGLRQLLYLKARGYSAIGITRPIWDEAGPFDENIWPGYFCDNDHHRSVGLAGFPTDHVDVETEHAGSACLKQDQGFADAISVAFHLNHEYFVKKWGGEPKQETFTVPFNGGAPLAGTYDRLPPAVRHALECRYA